MQHTNATTIMPIAFVRDIISAMSGTNVVDFDDADFDALPAQGHVSASFVVSQNSSDAEHAVNSAWPYPSGAQNVDAIIVVRGNGIMTAHYNAISDALRRKVSGSLFISVSKSSTLPTGAASILIFALSHNKAKKTPPPFLKLVVQDEAQHDSGE